MLILIHFIQFLLSLDSDVFVCGAKKKSPQFAMTVLGERLKRLPPKRSPGSSILFNCYL